MRAYFIGLQFELSAQNDLMHMHDVEYSIISTVNV